MKWGLAYWRWYGATGKSRAVEEFSPKRMLPELEVDGVAGVEEERPLEALPVARRGLVRWWSCAGARASSGVLFIAGPRWFP